MTASATTLVYVVPGAQGGVSGYSDVRRLDLVFVPGSPTLKARVTLASGLGLIYETQDELDADRLLKIAQVYAHQGVRLAVYVEQDQIKEFHVSLR
jgi:hypothetical protein